MGVLKEMGRWDDGSVVFSDEFLRGEKRTVETNEVEGKVELRLDKKGNILIVQIFGEYYVSASNLNEEVGETMNKKSGVVMLEVSRLERILIWGLNKNSEIVEESIVGFWHRGK